MENKPNWKLDLDSMLAAGKVAAHKNPGTSHIFNGKHWIPLETALINFDTLSNITNDLANALKAVHTLFVANGHTGYEAYLVRNALASFEAGVPSKSLN